MSPFVVRPTVVVMPRSEDSPFSRERPPNLNDANFSSSQASGAAVGPGETSRSSGADSEFASMGEGSNTAGGDDSSGPDNLRPHLRGFASPGVDIFAVPRLTIESLMAHDHRSAYPSYPDSVDAWRRDGHPFPVANVEPAVPAASESMRAARHPRSYATDLTAQSTMPPTTARDMDHDINGAGTRFDDEVIAPWCDLDLGGLDVIG